MKYINNYINEKFFDNVADGAKEFIEVQKWMKVVEKSVRKHDVVSKYDFDYNKGIIYFTDIEYTALMAHHQTTKYTKYEIPILDWWNKDGDYNFVKLRDVNPKEIQYFQVDDPYPKSAVIIARGEMASEEFIFNNVKAV